MKKRIKQVNVKLMLLVILASLLYMLTTYFGGYGFSRFKDLIIVGISSLVLIVAIFIQEKYPRKKLLKTLKTSEMKIDKQFVYDSQAMCFDYEKRLIAILFYKKSSSIPVGQIVSFDDISDKKTEVRFIGKKKYLTLSFNVNLNGKREEAVMCEVLLKEDMPLGEVNLKDVIDKNEEFKKVNELSNFIDGVIG